MGVGEVAKRTGLSVRTLHHYDELGLLTPTRRTAAGHRLYGAREIRRLQQIRSLQQLGFSLDEIGRMLDRRDFPLRKVIAAHAVKVREQIRLQTELCERLESLERRLDGRRDIPVEQFMQTMEALTMTEAMFTPEQMRMLEQRRAELGEAGMREAEQAWPTLIAEVRAAMEKGTDPASARVQSLARRWRDLVRAFTGGDAGIASTLNRHYSDAMARGDTPFGMDAAMFAWVGKAMEAVRGAGEAGLTG